MRSKISFKIILGLILAIFIVGVGCLYLIDKNKRLNSPYIPRCELKDKR